MPQRLSDDPPQRPRAEPEILPPDRGADARAGGDPRVFVTRHRVVIAPPGPLGLLAVLLGVGLVAVAGFLTVVGLFLLWIPILGVVAAGFILAALLRGPRRS